MERKVLILGSGFVSGPAIDYLSADGNLAVTVGKTIFDCKPDIVIQTEKHIIPLWKKMIWCVMAF